LKVTLLGKGLAVALTLIFFGRLQAELVEFTTVIDGSQANLCLGTGSPATGTGTLILDTQTGTVTYDMNVRTDLLMGRETFAHVHGPGAPCVEGPVLYDLPLGSHKQGTGQVNAQAQADMLKGLHYMNVHTTAAGPGEVRGQIVPKAPKVPALSPWAALSLTLGLVALGSLTLCRRRAAPLEEGGRA
jgi:hypothetical protein